MNKYRIKLSTGRVIGPFLPDQIRELVLKGKVEGNEKFQVFPTGDWKSYKSFNEISEIINNADVQNSDPTFIKKLSDINFNAELPVQEMNTAQIEFPKEFSFDLKEDEIQKEKTSQTLKEEKTEEEVEKTRIVTRLQTLHEETSSDKTQINPNTLKYLEELRRQKELDEKQKKKELKQENKEESSKEAIVDMEADSTQFINLNDINKNISEEIVETESDFDIEAEKEQKIKDKLSEPKEIIKEECEEKPKNKKKIYIVLGVLLALFILFDGEDQKPKLEPISLIEPQILFPQRFDVPSKQKAEELFKKASEVFELSTYRAKIKSSMLFRQSTENKFKENKALARLIYVYSSLLENSSTFEESASKIFKLVQITKKNEGSDPLYASAISNFYYSIGKYEAAVKIIEKFNILKTNNPTTELFSVYLKALLKTGDMIKAEEVSIKLIGVKNKKYDIYNSLYDFYILKGDYTKASELVAEAILKYPKNVGLILKRSQLLIYAENFEGLKKNLKILRALKLENSRVYYSKYNELKALYFVKMGNEEKAVEAFEKALKLNESVELRSKLALLDAGSSEKANKLIFESKAIKLIQNSKQHMKKNNWKFAFKDALEATRVAPNYLPAQIYLTSLQIKQGFFKEAIESLEGLFKKYPLDPNVAFALVDTFIESYKFGSAKKILEVIGAGNLRADPRYYSMSAKYFIYKNDYQSSIAWLTTSINKNPIDDKNTFELAKVFIKNRKYNKAKLLLRKAQDLDPVNLDYRISYSDILYEIDGADSAIGYLYSVLEDFPDNAKILSTIGIYYYRSGQAKMFLSVKDKVLKLPTKSTALFEFLIQAAKMDEDTQAVINYSKDLIDINPGDLRARLFLAKVYIELYKYKEAFAELRSIESRLETYPKLQYYMSKLYLLTDNIEKAQELSEKEIKANPNSIDGYILMAEIKKTQKKFSEAEKYYKRAQRVDTKNVDVLMGLAYINYKKSQFEISLDLYKKARQYDPSNVEVHRQLGDVYRKIGQSALAIESYRIYLELFPNTKHKDTLQNYINMMQ